MDSAADHRHLSQQLSLLERCVATAYAHAPEIERAANRALNEVDDATLLSTAGGFAYFVEMVSSCLTLIRERRLSATYTISRAALLALADLHNLKKNPDYALHMDSGRIAQWTRFLENAQLHPNPLVEPMAQEFDLSAEAEEMRANAMETGDAGGRTLKDWDRLDAAGFVDEYRTVYWLWSLHAHANLGAIWGAHVRQDGTFKFRPKDMASAFLPDADGLCAMAMGAMYAVFPQFGVSTAEVDALRSALSELRAEMGFNDGPASRG